MPPSPVVPLDFSNLPLNLIQESVEVHCNTAKFERKQFFQVQLGGDYDEFNVNWLKAKLKKCGVPKTFITKGPDQTRGAKGWAFIGELDPDKPNLSCLNKAVQYFTEPDKQCLEVDKETDYYKAIMKYMPEYSNKELGEKDTQKKTDTQDKTDTQGKKETKEKGPGEKRLPRIKEE